MKKGYLRKNPGSGKEKKKQREALKEYRRVHAALAIHRDNGYCVACFVEKKGYLRKYEHVHHVFGRGTKAGDEKERYTSLMCLCAFHHRHISIVRFQGKRRHKRQLTLLGIANNQPINPDFEHNTDEQNCSF
jgi:hypothetical protein